MPSLRSRYCGICRYFSNSAAQAVCDSGGNMPVTGCHSVIDRPDRLSRMVGSRLALGLRWNSVQGQLVVDVAEPVGGGAAALLDVDRVQFAFDVAAPELEEFAELREFGGEVEFLPDEGLQQGGMVRQPV